MFDIKKLEAEERKNERISALLTLLITMVLASATLFWKAYRQTPPPPGEVYEVVGAIDFGDMKQGSRQINNFEPARKDPAPRPKPPSRPIEQAEVSETTPEPDPIVTTPEPETPVTQPEKPPKEEPDPTPPKPAETVRPEEKPQPEETPNDIPEKTSDTQTETQPDPEPSDKPSGSNQGNEEDAVGNQGQDAVKKLDPDGLYSFGQGAGGGLSNRIPLSLPKPVYNVQEEGDIKFEFIIRPDGTVAYAKVVGVNTKPGLARAGIDAIKKWRFSKSDVPNQRVTVTIKFRLKG